MFGLLTRTVGWFPEGSHRVREWQHSMCSLHKPKSVFWVGGEDTAFRNSLLKKSNLNVKRHLLEPQLLSPVPNAFVLFPLDMKGIIGAATVVGCLQHGVGICDERSTGSSLLVELKASSLAQSRDDANFLAAFRHSATVKTGEFPPAALVELYHEPEAIAARLRRLHLVIVDLCHPRKTATRIEKQFYQQITRVRDAGVVSITPILTRKNGDAAMFLDIV